MNQFLQNARWIGLLLCAPLCSVWFSECAAAPLVLRGTATVATVEDNYENGGTVRRLPFAAAVGDTFAFFLSIGRLRTSQAVLPHFVRALAASNYITINSKYSLPMIRR